MTRSSPANPTLHIDMLPVGRGNLGLTRCPGKESGGALMEDLDTIRDWGADLILSLVETSELATLQVSHLGDALAGANLPWLHLPIQDFQVPSQSFLDTWREAAGRIHGILDQGGKLLIHCKAGLGRTGTVAAMILIERGTDAETAIQTVRAARPGAIETDGQVAFLMGLTVK